MTIVSMRVNGKAVAGDVEGRTLLSAFLREELGLTGTHIGCDAPHCEVCTVHVNGKQIKSCTMFALEAQGAEVKTVEGMAEPDGSLGVVQQAFQDHHGLQCGFCTPGMVMAVAALLDQNANPTEAEVRHHLEGNLCRCTGYHNIVKAALSAAATLRGESVAAE